MSDSPTTPLWLSHHFPADYDRCFRIGGMHLCARCVGVYPVAFAGLALQIALKLPREWTFDSALVLGLAAPAFFDWARGRFDPRSGSNLGRFLTGSLLGVSLARAFYLHVTRPMHPLAMTLFLALFAGAVAVELASWPVRKRRVDPNRNSPVSEGDHDGAGPRELE